MNVVSGENYKNTGFKKSSIYVSSFVIQTQGFDAKNGFQ